MPNAPETTEDRASAAEPLLVLNHVSKTFPGQLALADVSIEVHAGEVVALLGENGSGKSTLVKILSGFHPPDKGSELKLGGEQLVPGSSDAHSRLRFVHQQSSLIDDMSVLENVCLGRGFHMRGIRIDWKREARISRERLAKFGFTKPPSTEVKQLTPAERAVVSIVRAVEGWDARGGVLVLDEPTAFLHETDVDRLLDAVRLVASEGAGVILVSHRIEDVFAAARRAFVLRDGRLVGTYDVASSTEEELVTAIVGRPLQTLYPAPPSHRGRIVLSVRGLRAGPIKGLSFDLHEGEIVGITGTTGSGEESVAPALFGARRTDAGEVLLDGELLNRNDPPAAVRAGVAYVPADRAGAGSVQTLSVRENVMLTDLPSVTRGKVLISRQQEYAQLDAWAERLRLTPGSAERPFSILSGGNQQKAVMAKWLQRQPRVLLLEEPTNGVDIATKKTIFEMVGEAVAGGAAALVCSTNGLELAETCDRVLVLADGVLVAELAGEALTSHAIAETSYAQY